MKNNLYFFGTGALGENVQITALAKNFSKKYKIYFCVTNNRQEIKAALEGLSWIEDLIHLKRGYDFEEFRDEETPWKKKMILQEPFLSKIDVNKSFFFGPQWHGGITDHNLNHLPDTPDKRKKFNCFPSVPYVKCTPNIRNIENGFSMSEDKYSLGDCYDRDISYLECYNWEDKIRLGGNEDGGYVIADKLDYDCLIGCGIGNAIKFEKDFKDTFKTANNYIYNGAIGNPLSVKYLNQFNYVNKNISNHNSLTTSNLHELISEYDNIFLKMDIERSEYDWINSVNHDQLKKFKQIAIKFHDTFKLEERWHCLKKINKTHRLIHIHNNNCCRGLEKSCVYINGVAVPRTFEATYLRKDLFEKAELNKKSFPTEFDFSSCKEETDITLSGYPFSTREKAIITIVNSPCPSRRLSSKIVSLISERLPNCKVNYCGKVYEGEDFKVSGDNLGLSELSYSHTKNIIKTLADSNLVVGTDSGWYYTSIALEKKCLLLRSRCGFFKESDGKKEYKASKELINLPALRYVHMPFFQNKKTLNCNASCINGKVNCFTDKSQNVRLSNTTECLDYDEENLSRLLNKIRESLRENNT